MRAGLAAKRRRLLTVVCAVAIACAALVPAGAQGLPDEARLLRLREYIKTGWSTLTRSNRDLPKALPDPKMPHKPGDPWLLYTST